MFEVFTNRVILCATLEMETALSVGSHLSFEPIGTDLPVMKLPDGLPFIPGSSIKGAVRALSERILRSINRRLEFWACNPLDPYETCVPASQDKKKHPWQKSVDELWREAQQNEERFSQLLAKHSCTTCRIFGSPWLASRVSFKDAYLENSQDPPMITQIRDGVGIDRDLGAAKQKVKYDFEVVVPGTCFGIEILTENLEDWELGLLLSVLRFWEEGHLPLGGKVTRGPGWGRLKDLRLKRVDQSNLLKYLTGDQPAQESADRYLQAFRDYVKSASGQRGGINHAQDPL